MRLRNAAPRLEELEQRLLLKAPSDAPPLGPPPDPGPDVVWVDDEAGLQNAVRNVHPGETVVIRPGTYYLSQTLYIGLSHPVSDVTIRGATDNYSDVVLLGAGMENPYYGAVPSGISVYNAQNVMIADLSIGEVYYHPIELKGEAGADAIAIYHLRLFNAGEQFVKSTPGPDGGVNDSTVEYSVLEYTDGPPVTDHGGGTGYTNGVDVHHGSNWTIRDNLFRNFHTPDWTDSLWAPAVLLWNHSSGTVVEGNTFIDTDRAIAFGLLDQTLGYDHDGGIIRNNFIYQSPGLFSGWRTAGSDGQIIVWDSPDSEVYHNTVLTNGNSIESIEVRWTGGVQVRNDLTDAPIGARDGGAFSQSGNYARATPDMFIDPADGDLHLVLTDTVASFLVGAVPRLDRVSDDWDGAMRNDLTDIGAAEYKPLDATRGGFPVAADGAGLAAVPVMGPAPQEKVLASEAESVPCRLTPVHQPARSSNHRGKLGNARAAFPQKEADWVG
jgi:hypothetical protein